jgi:hypothetical protein
MTPTQQIIVSLICGAVLRDLWCSCAIKLRRLHQQRVSNERQQQEAIRLRDERIAKLMKSMPASPPFPKLKSGSLVIEAETDLESLVLSRQLMANFRAEHKQVFFTNGEEN